MKSASKTTRIAILGGGPSGMFVFKRLVESGRKDIEISIFEKKDELGSGMPYSREGASEEHITNVSGNEIPEIVSSMKEWIRTAPLEVLRPFDMKPENFNDYKVVPRLLFGRYLSDQFNLLLKKAKQLKIIVHQHLNTEVIDLIEDRENKMVTVVTDYGDYLFDHVVMTTGHEWPVKHEGKIPLYFDSPYPPAKIAIKVNFPVAIKGSSLTAIDAIRTLARHNGDFTTSADGKVTYKPGNDSAGFSMVMHSIDGLLPSIRFHLEDSHLSSTHSLSPAEIQQLKTEHDGFVPLDLIFERNFKLAVRERDPEFYEKIRDLSIEEFVEKMMSLRDTLDAFVLFRAEYAEAEKSIRRKESVYWKEMLAELSFTLNYPAKYLCAEDMIRLKKVLMPLISIVIAFVPQSSCRELMALHDAGVLTLEPVDTSSEVIPQKEGGAVYKSTDEAGKVKAVYYKMFVDCVGQPRFMYEQFPFKSLLASGSLSPARLRFKSDEAGLKEMSNNKEVGLLDDGHYYLRVPGININDHFQVLDKYGAYSEMIFVMAVPYIGGLNPDYSGLDFSEAASEKVVSHLATLSSLK